MKSSQFIIVLFFVVVTLGFKGKKNSAAYLPVFISYFNKQIPDSIQDFMKIYLQTKKIEVISFDGYMLLFKEQLAGKMNEWVTSGKADGMNATKIAKYEDEISKPICNLLAIKVFKDSSMSENYLIDSIHWYVNKMPVKDTNKIFTTFIPDEQSKLNPYMALKSFTEVVIKSKRLK